VGAKNHGRLVCLGECLRKFWRARSKGGERNRRKPRLYRKKIRQARVITNGNCSVSAVTESPCGGGGQEATGTGKPKRAWSSSVDGKELDGALPKEKGEASGKTRTRESPRGSSHHELKRPRDSMDHSGAETYEL